jgi:hypothetical protein
MYGGAYGAENLSSKVVTNGALVPERILTYGIKIG